MKVCKVHYFWKFVLSGNNKDVAVALNFGMTWIM